MSKDPKELVRPEYWNSRYTTETEDPAAHEWFRTFEKLRPFLERNLPPVDDDPRILQLGCGLSTLTYDLYNIGYHNQCSIDFSPVAIDFMKSKYDSIESLGWRVMDVRKMEFADAEFDCAIDKGTLDAMLHGSLWDPEPEVKANVNAYVSEVERVLKPGGRWLYITYRQPHFMRPLLQRSGWTMTVEALQDDAASFEYFAWVMVKHPSPP
ncbi:S-adenosyl-L-methionine-dependent methyltransferase [Trichodelitschia bisporula]|uniref:S-adenosyl-L-methionine-dependent methyltransferase n=1 Tax=Trichodelitschia bisporula TaxID=703511 RepID=A0A6G1HPS1_9PEZI|nr:S-adenosyl-L-methionine-dependent methyltransferase [Trichodelitschia bisporula]